VAGCRRVLRSSKCAYRCGSAACFGSLPATDWNYRVRHTLWKRPCRVDFSLDIWLAVVNSSSEGGKAERQSGAGIDSQEFEAFYRREAPRLRRRLKRRVWGEDDSSDIVQEAFVRLAESTSDAARQNPGAYIHGIIRNLLADRVRRWAKARAYARLDALGSGETWHDPSTEIELTQMRKHYVAAINTLPPRTREVFLLHRVEELDYKVIANRLGISIRTVEWHVAQAIIRITKSVVVDG